MQPPSDESQADGASSTCATGSASARFGFWDAVSIIVGIVVGTAIFRSAPLVFANVAGPWQAMGLWLLGGVLCLVGALCYAELATTYPRNGGDYEYLTRAFGPWMGFLFGWAQLAVILTGSIGAMAYAFADYAVELWDLPPGAATAWIAAAAVAALSAVNLFGLVVGKSVQNLLSVAKILGLAGVVLAGLLWGSVEVFQQDQAPVEWTWSGLGLALVFVLYAYGGWNDAVFVAAEVSNPRRNLPWALFVGILGITLAYLAVNAAYLAVLGFDAARTTQTPAAAVMAAAMGPAGAKAVSVLVMVSALGAINGMILAGSRVYATVGEDHRLFAGLARWNTKTAVPAAALAVQAVVALLLILAVGTSAGRCAFDTALTSVGLSALPWEEFGGGFDVLVSGTAPVFWTFFLLTGVSLFVLRTTDPARPRPFRVPAYPIPPLVFCATCLFMLYSSLAHAQFLSLLGFVPLAIGLAAYGLSGRREAA